VSITSLTASTPAAATGAPYGTPVVSGRQWNSDPRIDEQGWSELERLTSSDRALIKQVTGQDIPTRSSGKPPIAPIFAFQIAMDRQSGMLATGQPVTAAYITDLINRYRQGNPFEDQLEKALGYLTTNPPSHQLDINA